jgi:hypothetical protein
VAFERDVQAEGCDMSEQNAASDLEPKIAKVQPFHRDDQHGVVDQIEAVAIRGQKLGEPPQCRWH